MKLRTWKYYIKQGFKGIAKNGLMSLASVIIVSACAFIVILSLCIIANIDYILTQIESNVSVILYMGDKPTDEQVMELKSQIESMPHVVNVDYKTAQEALEEYSDKTNQNLVESFKNDNPLPRTMHITLDDIKYQKSFAEELKQVQFDFEEEILDMKTQQETTQATTQAATQATTQAATQATTQAATQATTQAAQATTQAAVQSATQAATQAVVQAPAPTTQAATQATTQAATQATTQAANLPVKNEAEAPAGISPNMPEIASQATTESVVTDGPVLGDADYEFAGIEKIQQPQQLTDTLVTIDTVFKLVAAVIIGILCIVAVGIIMNTIKLTVFIRKNEINIMKYVGATDWFIRWPFIIEGIVIGIIGAAIPTVLCWFGYFEIYDVFTQNTFLSAIGNLREGNEIFKVIAPVTIGVGILLGAVGSINSIRKHLKV